MTLSIIIVTYNSKRDIFNCLSSIPRSVAGDPVEVLVVDNSSTDGTVECVKRDFDWVKLLALGDNVGFSKANNLGYEQSSGDFILFLNPDTVVNLVALEACLNRLDSDPQIGVISPKLIMADGTLDLACRRSIPVIWDGVTRATGLSRRFPHSRLCGGYNLTYLPENETYDVGAVNGAFMLFPRRILTRIGIFDERIFMYSEDLDLCLRCSQAGYRVVYDGRYSIIHLKGQSSSKAYKAMSEALFSSTKFFYLKHFNVRNSAITKAKYDFLFWLWAQVNRVRARFSGHTRARPI